MTTLATTLVTVTFMVLSLCGCGKEVTYKPDYVPIVVTVDQYGQLWVEFDGTLVTKYGTFTLQDATRHDANDGEVLLAITHDRDGVQVVSLFGLVGFAKANTELTVTDGKNIDLSVDKDKSSINVTIPPGAQEFTLEAADDEKVTRPSTSSVSSWSEPPLTSTSEIPPSEPPSDTTSPTNSTSKTATST